MGGRKLIHGVDKSVPWKTSDSRLNAAVLMFYWVTSDALQTPCAHREPARLVLEDFVLGLHFLATHFFLCLLFLIYS